MYQAKEKSTDFVILFQSINMPFLISSIALRHYKELNVIAMNKDERWSTYLPKFKQDDTLREGVALYENEQYFCAFRDQFQRYMDESVVFFKAICQSQDITKKEAKKFFESMSKFWFFYKKTEFFYTDSAYEKSMNDSVTAKNIFMLKNIKETGRQFMNNMIFGSKSFLAIFIERLAKIFKISTDELLFFSTEEILKLYDRAEYDRAIIENRKRSYVFKAKNGKIITFQGDEAELFIDNFCSNDDGDEIFKGVIANKGKATAVARVLFYGHGNFDSVHEFISEMVDGEVLVADTTSPELVVACKKAVAILTNQGGLLSHAAITSRELGIPCIVGLGNVTHKIKSGDLVDVDADHGIVKILNKKI